MTPTCASCGTTKRLQLHHACYRQAIRRYGAEGDKRNLVYVCKRHHDRHHSRQEPLELSMLPDSVYEFAREVLGDGPAFVYLSRRYRGGDDRLEALISNEEAA